MVAATYPADRTNDRKRAYAMDLAANVRGHPGHPCNRTGSPGCSITQQLWTCSMAILEEVNPQPISGNWRFGYSLDFHNVAHRSEKSETRTPLAQALTWSDEAFRHVVADVADGILELLSFHELKHDLIVPIPPSDGNRDCRILDLCHDLSAKTGAPVAMLQKTRVAPSLRGVDGREARLVARQGLYAINEDVRGKSVLVADDVYLTGATLRTVASLLTQQGAAAVDVVTLTRSGGILWAKTVAENKELYQEFSTNDYDDAYLNDGMYVTAEGKLVDRG